MMKKKNITALFFEQQLTGKKFPGEAVNQALLDCTVYVIQPGESIEELEKLYSLHSNTYFFSTDPVALIYTGRDKRETLKINDVKKFTKLLEKFLSLRGRVSRRYQSTEYLMPNSDFLPELLLSGSKLSKFFTFTRLCLNEDWQKVQDELWKIISENQGHEFSLIEQQIIQCRRRIMDSRVSVKERFEELINAAELGDIKSARFLFDLYCYGPSDKRCGNYIKSVEGKDFVKLVEKNWEKAESYAKFVLQKGIPDLMLQLGTLYLEGGGKIQSDLKKAIHCYLSVGLSASAESEVWTELTFSDLYAEPPQQDAIQALKKIFLGIKGEDKGSMECVNALIEIARLADAEGREGAKVALEELSKTDINPEATEIIKSSLGTAKKEEPLEKFSSFSMKPK
jgi:hypothetical protein